MAAFHSGQLVGQLVHFINEAEPVRHVQLGQAADHPTLCGSSGPFGWYVLDHATRNLAEYRRGRHCVECIRRLVRATVLACIDWLARAEYHAIAKCVAPRLNEIQLDNTLEYLVDTGAITFVGPNQITYELTSDGRTELEHCRGRQKAQT